MIDDDSDHELGSASDVMKREEMTSFSDTNSNVDAIANAKRKPDERANEHLESTFGALQDQSADEEEALADSNFGSLPENPGHTPAMDVSVSSGDRIDEIEVKMNLQMNGIEAKMNLLMTMFEDFKQDKEKLTKAVASRSASNIQMEVASPAPDLHSAALISADTFSSKSALLGSDDEDKQKVSAEDAARMRIDRRHQLQRRATAWNFDNTQNDVIDWEDNETCCNKIGNWFRLQRSRLNALFPFIYELLMLLWRCFAIAVVIADLVTDGIVANEFSECEHDVCRWWFAWTLMFMIVPYIICWNAMIKFVYQMFFPKGVTTESTWKETILLTLYLFPPTGVLIFALFDMWMLVVPVINQATRLFIGKTFLQSDRQREDAYVNFRRLTTIMLESLPQAILQFYVVLYATDTDATVGDTNVLMLSFGLSLFNFLTNLLEIRSSAKSENMSIIQFSFFRLQLAEYPMPAFVPSLVKIIKGRTEAVNYTAFRFYNQGIAQLRSAILDDKSKLETIRISPTTVKELSIAETNQFLQALQIKDVRLRCQRHLSEEEISQFWNAVDTDKNGYIDQYEFTIKFRTELESKYPDKWEQLTTTLFEEMSQTFEGKIYKTDLYKWIQTCESHLTLAVIDSPDPIKWGIESTDRGMLNLALLASKEEEYMEANDYKLWSQAVRKGVSAHDFKFFLTFWDPKRGAFGRDSSHNQEFFENLLLGVDDDASQFIRENPRIDYAFEVMKTVHDHSPLVDLGEYLESVDMFRPDCRLRFLYFYFHPKSRHTKKHWGVDFRLLYDMQLEKKQVKIEDLYQRLDMFANSTLILLELWGYHKHFKEWYAERNRLNSDTFASFIDNLDESTIHQVKEHASKKEFEQMKRQASKIGRLVDHYCFQTSEAKSMLAVTPKLTTLFWNASRLKEIVLEAILARIGRRDIIAELASPDPPIKPSTNRGYFAGLRKIIPNVSLGGGPEGNPIFKKYELHEKLGSGTFATVRRILSKKDHSVQRALKLVSLRNLKDKEVEALKNEVVILGKVSHPNVVKLHESFITADKIYMVLDLLNGGELFDRIIEQTFFSEKEAARVVFQVASVLVYLHARDIVHRDLKPENLLLSDKTDDYTVKIVDFGLAKQSKDLMVMPVGTPGYVAPEILKRRKYHKEVDIWSLGVTTYILLCGFPPFSEDGNNLKNLYKQIRAGKYSFPKEYWGNISKEAILLIKKMLQVKPRNRISASKILTDKWIVTTGPSMSVNIKNSVGTSLRKTRVMTQLRKGLRILWALYKISQLLEKNLDDSVDYRKLELNSHTVIEIVQTIEEEVHIKEQTNHATAIPYCAAKNSGIFGTFVTRVRKNHVGFNDDVDALVE